jgi:hypothetical protein
MVPAFQDTSEAFIARWEGAGLAGGADREEVGDVGVATSQFQGRVLPSFIEPFSQLEAIPALGYGIGMGSNVGAQRLSGGLSFLIGEGAWENHLGEIGPTLGLAFIFWRVALALLLLRLSLQATVQGNRIPLILTGASLLAVLIGQISQPTGLGFIVLSGGLTFAALNPGTEQPSR